MFVGQKVWSSIRFSLAKQWIPTTGLSNEDEEKVLNIIHLLKMCSATWNQFPIKKLAMGSNPSPVWVETTVVAWEFNELTTEALVVFYETGINMANSQKLPDI